MCRWVLAALAIGILGAPPAPAGTIHDAVLDQLSLLQYGEKISVIVHMADRADIPALSASLTARKATRAERHREVVVALREAAAGQTPLLDRLETLRGMGEVEGYSSHWIINAVVVLGTARAIEEIAARPDVDLIAPNFKASLIEPVGNRGDENLRGIGVTPGLRAINADRVWYELGITGAGRLVANLDTGVDGNHPALASRWRGLEHPWQECWLDLVFGGQTFPSDSYGHGTHVMGTMTGLGAATEDTVGVAWGAQWIACNAINQGVSGEFDNDILVALDWFAEPDGDPGTVDDVPDVVQNSWGVYEGLGYPDCFSLWWAAIDNCEASGVVTTWSAGNEGPSAGSLRSPADRIASPYNTFSVGAVNATDYGFPYPIADFSSRGPSRCDNVTIKPEVVAPGVRVYSSVPGGGYQQEGWNGTSMAGPHAAGIVGLIREANPNLEVDVIKDIIMSTSIDFGQAGEDNTYGMGFVDAYEAVLASLTGFGTIQGTVTHAETGHPIEGAQILVVEADRTFQTQSDGSYSGMIPAGIYTVRATHPAFLTGTASGVEVIEGEVTTQNFALAPSPLDVVPPVISDVSQPCATDDTFGPYVIEATITDNTEYVVAWLFFRVNEGSFFEIPMTAMGGDRYHAEILGQPLGSLIEFYIEASDAIGNTATDPAGAPGSLRIIIINTPTLVFEDDAESDQGWTLGVPGDDATSGLWERADPEGTEWNGEPSQPEDDHTADPGVICFVTGASGGSAGDNDVDNGCTTLISPVVDLTGAVDGKVTYWRWYYDGGNNPNNDVLVVDVSSDGGTTWQPLERLDHTVNAWTEVSLNLCTATEITDQIQIRVVACDEPNNSLCEALVDDVKFAAFYSEAIGVQGTAGVVGSTRLEVVSPNPFNPTTRITYQLASRTEVKLEIFDVHGRMVETLVSGIQSPGRYTLHWDGTDTAGRALASGLYFLRLRADGQTHRERLTLLK